MLYFLLAFLVLHVLVFLLARQNRSRMQWGHDFCLVQVSVQRCHSHLDSDTQSQHESLTHGYLDRAYRGGVGCGYVIEAAPTWSHAGEALSFSMLSWLMTSETLVTLSAAEVDAHSRARHAAQCLSAVVYTSDAVIRSGVQLGQVKWPIHISFPDARVATLMVQHVSTSCWSHQSSWSP